MLIQSAVTKKPSPTRTTVNKIQIEYLAPALLKPNPWNSNQVGPEMEIRLEASIREFGFIKPVVCRKIDNDTLQIIGGEHRARKAVEMGLESIPVVVLEGVSDKRAKAMGLADNGRYGQDDAGKLSAILSDLDPGMLELLPFDDSDLAGIFSSASIDLDDLGLDDKLPDLDDPKPEPAARPKPTHELMRFKVPIEDRERVEKFIQQVIKEKGFAAEEDSMISAGMALVEIVNQARSA